LHAQRKRTKRKGSRSLGPAVPDFPSLIVSFGARQNSGYRPQTVPERHPNEPANLGGVKWQKYARHPL
jgi:hypothetical protein